MEKVIKKLHELNEEIKKLDLTDEEKFKLSSELSDFLCYIPKDLLVIPNWFSQENIKYLCDLENEENISDIMYEIATNFNPDEISEQVLEIYKELAEKNE